MSVDTCPSDGPFSLPAHARARGEISAEFKVFGGRTGLARLRETGGLRMLLPNVERGCEGVLINTAGGVAGGDAATYDFRIGESANVTLTSQAAEKIYRAQRDPAEIGVSLRIGAQARVEWLPQETILFDGARLIRRLDVDVCASGSLLLLECVVFGRLAMGESDLGGFFRDRWRVRRDGAMIFAEEARIDGDISGALVRPAIGGGARASALLLCVAPDAEAMIEPVRALLAQAPCEWGASAWNSMCVARLLSTSPEDLRTSILMLLKGLRGRNAPRVWQ